MEASIHSHFQEEIPLTDACSEAECTIITLSSSDYHVPAHSFSQQPSDPLLICQKRQSQEIMDSPSKEHVAV